MSDGYQSIWNPPQTVYDWRGSCPFQVSALLELNTVVHYPSFGIGCKFEAYPNGYIFRGEAKTPEEAERIAWESYQRVRDKLCQHDHSKGENCEKRGYKNGCGFCLRCGRFCMNAFEPDEFCVKCGARTYWTRDKDGKFWCEACAKTMPREQRDPSDLELEHENFST